MPLDVYIFNPNLLAMPVIPAGKTADEIRVEYGLERIVDVGSNENPLGPSPLAMEAVRYRASSIMNDSHDLRPRSLRLIYCKVTKS